MAETRKTTIRASIKKNRDTQEYAIHLHIDSPYEPGSKKHQELTEAVTAKLWEANFPERDFDSNCVKLFLMNHTTSQYEEVNEKIIQQYFFTSEEYKNKKEDTFLPLDESVKQEV